MSHISPEQTMETALVHHQAGRLGQAEALYRQILAQQPNHPQALLYLGLVAHQVGQRPSAIRLMRQAIALKPDWPEGWTNLGVALRDDGQYDEAIDAYRQALVLSPDRPHVYYNLGVALKESGKLDEAVAAYRQAVLLKSDLIDAHYGIALSQLLQGDFAQGWHGYELRWMCTNFTSPRRKFWQPKWDGSDLAGKTILLHSEQGFGDTIQFIRYVPMVAERGGKVILVCPPELRRLLKDFSGVSQLVTWDESLPSFDLHCPLLSLPLAFGTLLETVPNSVPYITPDAREVQRWREKLASDPQRLKVGLVWAGGPHPKGRSMSLAAFSPLSAIPGVSFYSLQTGDAAKEADNPPDGLKLINDANELKDFADTAALIANLDLVISIDTAAAHLAGAMAKPVFNLLQFAADFRWLLDRQDSPWYPTMRMFRQSKLGDWDSIIQQVTTALKTL
jgi:TPR repeat/Tetratricopeptide repeat